MKIVVVSKEGNSLDLALRLTREDHDVKFALPAPPPDDPPGYYEKFGEGLVERSADYLADAAKADLVICDDSALDKEMHELKKLGVPVFGTCYGNPSATGHWELGGKRFRSHEAAHILEKERSVVHHVLNELGVGEKVESLSFKDAAEAAAHLRDHPVPHVIKPESGGPGGAKTYVSQLPNGRDALGWLEASQDIKNIEVEEKIDGVELGCSLFANGRGFVGPLNVNFEHKRLWPGNLGPNCGEQGTVMFYDLRPIHRIPLFQKTIGKLEGLIRALDYRGWIDVNGIVNAKGFHVTELTPRLPYPLSYIMDELHETPWGELMLAIARGEDVDLKVRPGFAAGVVVFGEDYPNYGVAYEKCRDLPFYPEAPADFSAILDHFHPVDVRVKKGRMVLDGCYAGCVTARGETVSSCMNRIYTLLEKREIFFPNIAYHNQIGNNVDGDLAKLQGWGWDFLI